MLAIYNNSPVDLQKKGEPGKNSKKADFGIIRKQIFHRITYLKSCLGKLFMPNFTFGTSGIFKVPKNAKFAHKVCIVNSYICCVKIMVIEQKVAV